MTNPPTASLRNIVLLGHSGAGKTVLAENLLAAAGAIKEPGSIERGTTVCDYRPEEKRLQYSADVSVCHFEHGGAYVNLIDTPGSADFAGRALSVLPAAETAIIVINASAGIELMTRRAMAAAKAMKLARFIAITHIDSETADLAGLMEQITETFGRECIPLNLPADAAANVADCYFDPEDRPTDFGSTAEARTTIVDQVVELDDELMELYLEEGEDMNPERLHGAFERALRRGHLVPVCFVSSTTGSGINQLLNIMHRLTPSPREGNPPACSLDDEPLVLKAEKDEDVMALLFKINVDPYVGRMGLFRVFQGQVNVGDSIYLDDQRKPIKVAHLYAVQGAAAEDVQSVGPGGIAALSKINELSYGGVLHAGNARGRLQFAPAPLPAPMHGVVLELTRRGDEKKLSDALAKLTAEDPSLRLEFDAQANETVLRGMGELHLRVVLDRMHEEFGLEVETRAPRIAYRETVTRKAEGHHRHKKQTGGAGQFGEVFLNVEPLPRGSGFEFVDKVVGGVIPSQFMPAVEKGVRQVLQEGAVAGYPLQDIRVTVHDGKHHPVDSKEVAFVAAGKKAFIDAISKAKPIVLEPIAKLEVTTPGQHMGDIAGHLSGSRGRISGNDSLPGNQVVILAEAPIGELGDFQTRLKSLTGGEGAYTMEFDHYATAPPLIQKALEEAFKPSED
ncbi:elongation factor G [Candidatus Foliamicus sp.]